MGSGTGKKVSGALDRIEALEQGQEVRDRTLYEMVMATNNSFATVDQRLNDMGETLAAIVDHVGRDQIAETILKARKELAKKQVEENKAAIAKNLEEGRLKTLAAVGEAPYVLVGRETSPEGNVLEPGFVFVESRLIKPEVAEQLKGQGVGFKFETPTKNQFEVLELYEIIPPVTETSVATTTEDAGTASE